MATNGRFWRLYTRFPGGPWEPFAGAREESMNHTNRAVDRTDKEQDGYRYLLENAGRSVDMSLSAVAVPGVSFDRLLKAVNENAFLEMRAEGAATVLEGFFHTSSYSETGSNSQAVQFSASFQSAGPYKWLTPITLVSERYVDGVFTRDSASKYRNKSGTVVEAEPNQPRYEYANNGEYLGLLIQGAAQAGAQESLINTSSSLPPAPFSCNINARVNPVSRVQTLYQADDGTDNNRIRIQRVGQRLALSVTIDGATQADITLDDALLPLSNEPITINSDPLTLDGDPLTGDVITGDPKVRISVVFSYGGYGISVSYQGGAEIQAPADIKNLTRRQIGGPNPWGGWIEYINEPPIASGAAQLEPN